MGKIEMLKRLRANARKAPAPYRGSSADGRHSSRISTGRDLLPNEDGRSRWARLLKATYRALIQHCGGDDIISDMQRMACRRVAALEAELIHIEDRIAKLRRSRREPPASLLATYASLTAQQHRLSKELGWSRHAKPLNDEPKDLQSYLASKANAHHHRNGRIHALTIEHEDID
ncbi:hypothetical protein KMZ29_02575 [Bradyrhizobium sediminis]|uniref:Uncharacterized protein n=1 Tax=Bradyrhizobium sediminis TaxID=2840469 RepID=A0A975NEL7_9BRAD|nr:hypothetical protein [Bradyrhizobium sediminis]QWG13642.1 hypothetical protein KMZ29_02575 [Bradyrhizobium sediminis]